MIPAVTARDVLAFIGLVAVLSWHPPAVVVGLGLGLGLLVAVGRRRP